MAGLRMAALLALCALAQAVASGACANPAPVAQRIYFLLCHNDAQFNLADLYTKGDGVSQNPSEAARYLRLAADQGHAEAQYCIALRYAKGEGVPQNPSEAARYFRLSADQAYPPAQLLLGAMLIADVPVDEGTPTDPRVGAKLLARVVQCEAAEYEQLRLQALELLHKNAGQREVVAACCIGCGASRGLKRCDRCLVARFCGAACMRQMWPTHKRCCKAWQDEQGDESQQ
jgi:TPR repeat protein